MAQTDYSPYEKEPAEEIIRQLARLYIEHHQLETQEAIQRALLYFNTLRSRVDSMIGKPLEIDFAELGINLDDYFYPRTRNEFEKSLQWVERIRNYLSRECSIDVNNIGHNIEKFEVERAYSGLNTLYELLHEKMLNAPEKPKKKLGRKEAEETHEIIELCLRAYEDASKYRYDEVKDTNSRKHKAHSSVVYKLVYNALSPVQNHSSEALDRRINRYLVKRSQRDVVAEILSDIIDDKNAPSYVCVPLKTK